MASVSLSSAHLDWRRCLTSNSLAGAGKTKLVSKVIDHVSGLDSWALAYFYCNRNESTRRNPENILRSFVKQLSTSLDGDSIQNALVEIYKEKQKRGFASAKLSFEDSQMLLLTLIRSHPQTILVLDALDESDRQTRVELLRAFNYLIDKSEHLKIFISSRCDDDIKFQLEKKSNIGIRATDNGNDISKFVAEKIDRDQYTRREPLSENVKDEIIQTLLQKSQGM